MRDDLRNIMDRLKKISDENWFDEGRDDSVAINSKIDSVIDEIIKLIELL
jgi:hypothetical protein